MTEPDLSTLAGTLAGNVERLRRSVDALAASQRRVKAAVVGIIVALVLVVALGVVVAVVAVQASNASQQAKDATSLAQRNEESAKVTCEVGNESRKLAKQLWTYVLDLSSENPDLTAQQKKQIAAFRGYINTVYAPRDCSKPGGPVATPTPTR